MSMKHSFEEKCAEVTDSIVKRGALSFVICVDGSEAAHVAFRAAMALRKKYDFVAVFHASKGTEDGKFIQPDFRPAAIQSRYEIELVTQVPSDQCGVLIEPRAGRSFIRTLADSISHYTDSKLLRLLHDENPDFVVMGVVGRKGFKDPPRELGTNALEALNSIYLPCIVVKNEVNPGRRSYLYAVNNSPQSRKGLEILMKLVRPKDSLSLIHFASDEGDNEYLADLTSYFQGELDNFGPVDSSFTVEVKAHGVAITHAIEDYVNQRNPDFFCNCTQSKSWDLIHFKYYCQSCFVVNHFV